MAKKLFVKGNPGGPGRPKGGHIQWCQEFAEGEGKKKLIAWARCNNGKVSMQALTLIFAYGLGKPSENHNVTGTLTLEDLVTTASDEGMDG